MNEEGEEKEKKHKRTKARISEILRFWLSETTFGGGGWKSENSMQCLPSKHELHNMRQLHTCKQALLAISNSSTLCPTNIKCGHI